MFETEISSREPWTKEALRRWTRKKSGHVHERKRESFESSESVEKSKQVEPLRLYIFYSPLKPTLTFILYFLSELMKKLNSVQSFLSKLLNQNKKASTAVLFISCFITFCAYPYIDLNESDPEILYTLRSKFFLKLI